MGRRIYDLRMDRGLELETLARTVGWGHGLQLGRTEQQGSMPEGDKLVRLARELGTTAEYLYDGADARVVSHPVGAADMMTLSPRSDDPPALIGLADLLSRLGAPIQPEEMAWIRAMPGSPTVQDYQTALAAHRSGAQRGGVAAPAQRALAAPPLPVVVFPVDSGIQERSSIKPRRSSVKPAAKRRGR